MCIIVGMSEYCIYVGLDEQKKVPDDWRDKVEAQRGVSLKGGDERGIVVKCSDDAAEKLKKKFSYLTIEWIMPHHSELEEEEK